MCGCHDRNKSYNMSDGESNSIRGASTVKQLLFQTENYPNFPIVYKIIVFAIFFEQQPLRVRRA